MESKISHCKNIRNILSITQKIISQFLRQINFSSLLKLENYLFALFFLFTHGFTLVAANNNLFSYRVNNVINTISTEALGLSYTPAFDYHFKISQQIHKEILVDNYFQSTKGQLSIKERPEGYHSENVSVVPPFGIMHFEAKTNQDHQIQLVWTTDSESDNKQFIIEKSSDGLEFFPIGLIKQKGNTYGQSQYKFTDPIPWTGKNYYRIKRETIDGTISYSDIRKIHRTPQSSFKIFPNPIKGILHIRPQFEVPNNYSIEIFDNAGNLLFKRYVQSYQNNINIDISHFPSGIYYVQLNANNMRRVSQKLIKR